MNKKQEALLFLARSCAVSYIGAIPAKNDQYETRIMDFISGYCKGMKDCGYDVSDKKTLENIVIINQKEDK